MKKILIVNKSFETGGIQSTMVNMANELCKYYQVDLLIYNPEGIMRSRLDEKVNVINACGRLKALCTSPKKLIKSKNAVFGYFAMLWSKLFGNELPINMAIKTQPKLAGYDLAIAYHQEQRKKSVGSGFSRVVDKCVDAKVKAAWLHYDSDTVKLDEHFNITFYKKMDKVVCVSRSLMEAFAKNHPALADKMDYCYNFMTYDVMLERSKLEQEVKYPENKLVCFSACRIVNVKGLERAVNALAPVFREHPEVVWYIAGDGPEKINVENEIKKNGLEGRIVLIGNQTNPYTYMKNADLVMNVSYHEAAPMVFFESKALGTPVFATKTSSAGELLEDGVNSFVCENSERGLFEAFSDIVKNKDKITEAKRNLADFRADNAESLKKIEMLLDFRADIKEGNGK